MLEMKQMEKLAKITILNYLNHSYMTDDNIGLIVGYIIRGQLNYKDTHGTTLDTYLHNCARFGAMKVKQNTGKKKLKDKITVSLDSNLDKNDDKSFSLKELVASSDYSNEKNKQHVEYIMSLKILTETERECIKRHYLDKESINDISTDRKVTKQAVYAEIKRGIKKLRETFRKE